MRLAIVPVGRRSGCGFDLHVDGSHHQNFDGLRTRLRHRIALDHVVGHFSHQFRLGLQLGLGWGLRGIFAHAGELLVVLGIGGFERNLLLALQLLGAGGILLRGQACRSGIGDFGLLDGDHALLVDAGAHDLAVVAHDASHLACADARPTPTAHIAAIDVQESRRSPTAAVIADPTHLADKGVVTHLLRGDVGQINIDGLADHVLAFPRHVAANFLEEGIGLGAAVAGDDMDRAPGAQVGMQFPHQVDGLGRNGDGFVAPPVAQDVVQLLHGGGDVFPVLHVGDRDAFLGVNVIDRQRTGFTARHGGGVPVQECTKSKTCGNRSRGEDVFPTLDQGLTVSGFPAVQTHTPHTTGLVPVPSGAPGQTVRKSDRKPDYTEFAFRTTIRPP